MYQRLCAILMNMCDTLKLIVFCFAFRCVWIYCCWPVGFDFKILLFLLFSHSKLSVNLKVSSIQRLSFKKNTYTHTHACAKKSTVHTAHTQAQFQLTVGFFLHFLFCFSFKMCVFFFFYSFAMILKWYNMSDAYGPV